MGEAGSRSTLCHPTEAVNLVAHAYARPLLRPGDEIVVSVLEHH